jgi:hypothetical protein
MKDIYTTDILFIDVRYYAGYKVHVLEHRGVLLYVNIGDISFPFLGGLNHLTAFFYL